MTDFKSLLAASALVLVMGVTVPAIAGEDGKKHDEKEGVHCDRTKDTNCKDEHDHGDSKNK